MTFNICTTGIFQTLVRVAQGQSEWYDADDRLLIADMVKKLEEILEKVVKVTEKKRLSLNKKNRENVRTRFEGALQ